MGLAYELNGKILHVTETFYGATETLQNHWYYDIEQWLVSDHGREGDKPVRPMTPDSIAWVKRYYFPKVGL